jgi:hypothetical protein
MNQSLTPLQREVLIGLLLGDGHLETQNGGKTYRLKMEHSEAQRDYTEWLFKLFLPFCEQITLYEKEKNGKRYVGFRTRSIGLFRFYAQQFYSDKKKVMPKIIGKLLSETGIAIWFLDDGSKKSNRHKTYIIHSLGFTQEELERVQRIFQEKFSIEVSLHRQKQKYYRLYVQSKSASRFRGIMEPYVSKFASMKHKL